MACRSGESAVCRGRGDPDNDMAVLLVPIPSCPPLASAALNVPTLRNDVLTSLVSINAKRTIERVRGVSQGGEGTPADNLEDFL